VCAPVRIIFNAVDCVSTRIRPLKVDSPYPPSVTTSSMPDGDLTAIVSTSFAVTNLRKSQFRTWLSLPQVIIDGASKVTKTGCARLVCFELELSLLAHRGRLGTKGHCVGSSRGRGSRRFASGRIRSRGHAQAHAYPLSRCSNPEP